MEDNEACSIKIDDCPYIADIADIAESTALNLAAATGFE
jgi:hypothetical protein